jgi:cellobiose transport system substrate-binding protein
VRAPASRSRPRGTPGSQGNFATVTCPADDGYIQGQAPKTAGDWDVASVPGGGGNWGGSYLAVPKQSKNADLAYQLVKFLTSPASQAYVFKQTGNLPSQPALYSNPAIVNFKNPFFNNAPVGKIFTTSAKALKPQITGAHQGDIQTASTNAIERVEQKKQSPAQSWAQFLKDVENVAT